MLAAGRVRLVNCTMEDEGRYKCAFCCQELAHSAYYRHLHDNSGMVCPGRSSCDGDATYKDLMIADNGHFNDVDEATMLEDIKSDSSEFSFGSEDDASCGNNSLFDFGSADEIENESVMMGNLEPQYYDVSINTCT